MDTLIFNWALCRFYGIAQNVRAEEKIFSLTEAERILSNYGNSPTKDPKNAHDLRSFALSLHKMGHKAIDEGLNIENYRVKSLFLENVEDIAEYFRGLYPVIVEKMPQEGQYYPFFVVTDADISRKRLETDSRTDRLAHMAQLWNMGGNDTLAQNYALARIAVQSLNLPVAYEDFDESRGRAILVKASNSLLNTKDAQELAKFHTYLQEFTQRNPLPLPDNTPITWNQPDIIQALQSEKDPMSRENTHFTPTPFDLAILTNSATAKAKGIDNSLTEAAHRENLQAVFKMFNIIETQFQTKLPITSGYRNPDTVAALKEKGYPASTGSAHESGLAIDFALPANKHHTLMKFLRDNYSDTISQAISYDKSIDKKTNKPIVPDPSYFHIATRTQKSALQFASYDKINGFTHFDWKKYEN